MPSALQFWKSVVTNPLQQFQTPTLNKGSCRSYLAQCLEGLRMKSMKRLQITPMANSRLLCKTLHAFLGSRKGEDKKWWNRVFFYFIDLFLDHFHQWCIGFLYREKLEYLLPKVQECFHETYSTKEFKECRTQSTTNFFMVFDLPFQSRPVNNCLELRQERFCQFPVSFEQKYCSPKLWIVFV